MHIALEGIDGTGKTTSCKLLQKLIESQGVKVNVFHDPDLNEPLGRFVYESYAKNMQYDNLVWALLFASSSINLQSGPNGYYQKLKNGEAVILDRSVFSTYAYYWGKCSLQWLDAIHEPYNHPDLTIVLDLNIEEILKRIQKRDVDKGIPSLDKLRDLREKYLSAGSYLVKKGINIKYLTLNGLEDAGMVVNKIEAIVLQHYKLSK